MRGEAAFEGGFEDGLAQGGCGAGLGFEGEVKRRTDVAGIFPNERSIIRLAGAILLEQNDERAVRRTGTLSLGTIANIGDDPLAALSAMAAGRELHHAAGHDLGQHERVVLDAVGRASLHLDPLPLAAGRSRGAKDTKLQCARPPCAGTRCLRACCDGVTGPGQDNVLHATLPTGLDRALAWNGGALRIAMP